MQKNFQGLRSDYKIIYADPPWVYNDKQSNRPGIQYETMNFEQIGQLPVKEIADKDSVCCMWVTLPQLQEGLSVMREWGFEYKTTLFNWIKTYEKSGKIFWGMGRYTRSNSELVLLGKRGKGIPVANHGIHQVQLQPILKHSEKPAIFRDLIVDLFDAKDLPKIELFCRHSPNNWDVWGNEVGKLQ